MNLKLLKSVLRYTVSEGGSKLPDIPYRNRDKAKIWKVVREFQINT